MGYKSNMATFSITGDISQKNIYSLPNLNADDVVRFTVEAKVSSLVKPASEDATPDGSEEFTLGNDIKILPEVFIKDSRNLFVLASNV